MTDEVNYGRRHFLSAAAILAAAKVALTGAAAAQTSSTGAARTATFATRASLQPLKQIDAGLLNIGYVEESGPANGPIVILLHGWPYDIDAFAAFRPKRRQDVGGAPSHAALQGGSGPR